VKAEKARGSIRYDDAVNIIRVNDRLVIIVEAFGVPIYDFTR
jgi:hypothetical protein